MSRPTDRRALLVIAGVAAFAAAAGSVDAKSTDIQGTVTFWGGAVIPAGQVDIFLEDPAILDKTRRRLARTHLTSDGGSQAIAFSLTPSAASPTSRIVVRLERADGWLLARGSASLKTGSTIHVTLNAVIH